jgi:hypothetical protein
MFFMKNQTIDERGNADSQAEKAKRLNKKLRITDTIDTNKEIDLPIAMKYRLSKT